MKNTLISLFFVVIIMVSAQEDDVRRCSPYLKKQFSKSQIDSLNELFAKKYNRKEYNHSSKRTESTIRIPVVFHIIHNNPTGVIGIGSNITDEQIKSQIEVLNQDFRRKSGTRGFNSVSVGADTEIEFFLATTDDNCMATKAITRHYYAQKAVFDVTGDETIIKSMGYWPNDKFLNIWVASILSGFLGMSPFPNNSSLVGLNGIQTQPELDGVIVNHKTVGNRIGTSSIGSDSYAYGRTTTHEIGHWLGLFHTWGAGIGCEDDFCNDTPESNGGNSKKDNCTDKFSNCTGAGLARIMIENYMDYSEDKCMNIFTQDQKSRMRATLTNSPAHTTQIITTDFPTQYFNSINSISDLNWSVTNSISTLTGWKIETSSQNQKNLIVENNANTIGNKSILQTIFYDFPTSTGDNLAVIDFDITYPEVSDTDSLVVSIYTGCKTNPIHVKTITEAELRSNNLPKNHIISIPKLPVNLDYLKLQFENRSRGKADLRIDNIKLNKPFTNSIKLDAKIVYTNELKPNSVMVQATDSSNLYFEIIDILGKKYASYSRPFNYNGIYDIPEIYLGNGMYFLRIITENASFSTRFIMNN